ncbi:hypothetical protein ASD34_12280 [Variovorax sp. Root473]|nr:hypothetical protein ASD34_12280 [Variovorax sp. Root473]
MGMSLAIEVGHGQLSGRLPPMMHRRASPARPIAAHRQACRHVRRPVETAFGPDRLLTIEDA